MGATVAPDKILKELADLWVSTAKEGSADASAGVLRACSMTLIVISEESEDTQDLGETIAALMPEHPARAILIRLSGAGNRALSERVYSQCWMPFGQRRQICCEQVEITASDAALADLPSVVLPLAVPDLPVMLWCRSPRLPGMPEFWRIAAMAQKVILDSAALPDATGGLLRIAAMVASGALMADLSWTRLTRWREMLAQVFENRQYLAQLASVSKIEVEYGEAFHAAALYLGPWVSGCLANAGVKVGWTLTPVPAGVSLHLKLTGDGLSVELARQEDRMVVTVDGVSKYTSLPVATDYLLMREELGIVRRDPIFEKSLARAAEISLPLEIE
jgi:glucose-6-phosphate dehydrogenase assembly protein OpcA